MGIPADEPQHVDAMHIGHVEIEHDELDTSHRKLLDGIITVTNDILKKLTLVGKDLSDYSLDTVKMFFDDGKAAGFKL